MKKKTRDKLKYILALFMAIIFIIGLIPAIFH